MSQFPVHLIAAASGGALGASARYLFLALGIGGPPGILLINVAGAFGLGIAIALFEGRSDAWVVFVCTGIFGALTTFSTFAFDAVRLGAESPLRAGVYVVGSVALAIPAFILGTAAGRAM